MTSWILAIDADHPQHWDYAKRDKVWDLRVRPAAPRTVGRSQCGVCVADRRRTIAHTSRPQQRQRYNTDPVWAAVGGGAGVDNDRVQKARS
ncbi:hypothetical protein GCM10010401_12400 [Rarobacter faecitabidus]